MEIGRKREEYKDEKGKGSAGEKKTINKRKRNNLLMSRGN